MRQLHLVFAQTDKMARVLVAAAILPLSGGCGGETADSGQGTGGSSAQGGAASSGGNAATGGTFNCPGDYSVQSYTVTLPGGDTPADAAAVCQWGGALPSNVPAARVTLQYDSNTPSHATGTITVAPEILAAAGYVGVLAVTADTAAISNLTRVANTYTFDMNLTNGALSLGMSLTFQVTLDFACSPAMSSTRQLQTATNVVLCGYYGNPNWVSTGDTCTTCYPMAEMAAQLMPAPEREPDGVALPGELNINIAPVAREGRIVVLMVQKPSDTPELSLTWRASGGQLLLAADDVAVWTLPDEPGPHQVQVAALAGQSASIATYLCRDQA